MGQIYLQSPMRNRCELFAGEVLFVIAATESLRVRYCVHAHYNIIPIYFSKGISDVTHTV